MTRVRAGCLGLTTVALLSVLAGRAEAEDRPPLRVELRYVLQAGPRGCPTAEGFREDVARQLPFDAFGPDPTAILTVTIAESANGLRATVALSEGGTFTQQIDASRGECAALAGASAQAVVLAIERLRDALESATDAHAPTTTTPAAPTPPDEPSPRPANPPSNAATTRSADRSHVQRVHVDTLVVAAVSRGHVPAVGGGVFFGASLRRAWWRLGLELGSWWPTRIVSTGPDGAATASARVAFSSAGLEACAVRWRLFACGTVDLADVRATGTDERRPRSAGTVVGVLGSRLGVTLPLGPASPWAVDLFVGAGMPTSRVVIRANDELLWHAPPLSFEGGLRLRMPIL